MTTIQSVQTYLESMSLNRSVQKAIKNEIKEEKARAI